MKLLVFVNGDGPEMREAKLRAADLVNEDYEVEVLDWEAEETADAASLYDIYSTPAFVIIGPDGGLVERWQGTNLPLTSDMKHLM